jgi:hypothetical protein
MLGVEAAAIVGAVIFDAPLAARVVLAGGLVRVEDASYRFQCSPPVALFVFSDRIEQEKYSEYLDEGR